MSGIVLIKTWAVFCKHVPPAEARVYRRRAGIPQRLQLRGEEAVNDGVMAESSCSGQFQCGISSPALVREVYGAFAGKLALQIKRILRVHTIELYRGSVILLRCRLRRNVRNKMSRPELFC